MKILIMLTSILLITGCLPRAMQPPPDGWRGFRAPKNTSSKMIGEDMLTCGFDSPHTIYIASNDEQNTQYINATLCMENKGYKDTSLPKGVCHRYPDSSPCQARQSNNPK